MRTILYRAFFLLLSAGVLLWNGHEPAQAYAPLVQGGWTQYSGDFIQLYIPQTWIEIGDTTSLTDAVDQLTEIDPDFAEMAEAMAFAMQAGEFDLLAVDPESLANFLVFVLEDVGGFVTPELLGEALESQVEQFGMEVVDSGVVELPAGEAFYMQVEASFDVPGVSEFTQFQYYLIVDGTLYLIGGTARADDFEAYSPIFERIINTLEITGAESYWPVYEAEALSIKAPPDWDEVEGDALLTLTDDEATFTLTTETLDESLTLDDVEETLTETYAEADTFNLEPVDLPVGDFIRAYVWEEGTASVIYAAVNDTELITATFTVAEALGDYAFISSQMMDTLRLEE